MAYSACDGDVFFAKITPCMENSKGAVACGLANGRGMGSTEFHNLRPSRDVTASEWIYHFIKWEFFRKTAEQRMTGSAGQKRVPAQFLRDYEIPLPPCMCSGSSPSLPRCLGSLLLKEHKRVNKMLMSGLFQKKLIYK